MSEIGKAQTLSTITNENITQGVRKQESQKPSPEVVTIRTYDSITYTIKSTTSKAATQTLHAKLEASISRELAREIAKIT